MPVQLFFALNIVLAVISFGVLPFLNYFVLPFNKRNRLKEVDGKIELNPNLSKAFTDIKIEDGKIILKRAEGVQRIGLVVFYKRGILTLRKYYYLELAKDEISLPKLSKGEVFKMVVSEVDGIPSYKGIAYGINMPLFVASFFLQFVPLLTFSILIGAGLSGYLDYQYVTAWHKYVYIALEQRSKFFVLPIIFAVIVSLISLIGQVVALEGKLIKKEVK